MNISMGAMQEMTLQEKLETNGGGIGAVVVVVVVVVIFVAGVISGYKGAAN
ncbi:hypothetical protein [Paenibacillus sp. FSL R7-0272]|uniref:hypothetical protein n=1 Tax=Paenibacillus sp. FSL R7-0272 TaxID=2921679 RepID=UPI000F9B212C